jgi:superfamily II DNA or RNA helicase
MRTPSFLVRYVDLGESDSRAAVEAALHATDGSGMTLTAKLEAFARQVRTMTAPERLALWDALATLHTGSRRAESAGQADDVEQAEDGVLLLPNVHLANGETKAELRKRLMVTFNTPFLPEILVASSVMAEGVDLHRDCRHVIHHDLDWNPSTLEQRTGRVDRLGSKASMTGQEILVCEPYVAGTQDEKQYVVVKDRDRWFGVLMGGRVPGDEWATDKIAERVQLPDDLLKQLTLDLSVWMPTA